MVFTSSVSAKGLVDMTVEGEARWNVLGAQDELAATVPGKESIQIKQIAGPDSIGNSAQVKLESNGGKVQLLVEDQNGKTQADVTNYKSDLIVVEERNVPQSIAIKNNNGSFEIYQKDVVAVTPFPISINTKTHEFSVSISTGSQYLGVLPFEAVESLVKANVINQVAKTNKIKLEEDSGNLVYIVPGRKNIHLFSLMSVPVDITSYVSATTGQIVKLDQPTWYKILGFLFV